MRTSQQWRALRGFVNFSTDPYVFDVDEYIDKAVPDKNMLLYSETRRELTKANPLLFAMLYLPHHLKGADDEMYFSLFHLTAYKWASGTWHQKPGLDDARDAFLCSRGAGKSTTLFMTLLLWAAAHGYTKFVAGYSDSESTVKNHFDTFKSELKENDLIKADYPHLSLGKNVWEKADEDEGGEVRDTAMFFKTYGGFIFAVKSISSNSLGLKVGPKRPDFILLDDVERPAGDYSPAQAKKRLQSITGGILGQSQPLGARVVLVGTNLMVGSIIDGMIKKARGEEAPEWIDGANFKVHWFRPFIRRDDGTKDSCWPGVWPTKFLLDKESNDPDFGTNFDNQPMASGGAFWESTDFELGTIPPELISFGLLSIDPAVTSTRKSDYTAMSVVFYSRKLNRYEVVFAGQYKITPAQIREKVANFCNTYSEITSIYIETTQGGDTWKEILSGIPVKIMTEKPTEGKELRASRALNVYQTIQEDGSRRVVHRTKLPDLEAQMRAFPAVPNDDLVDCVTQAINAVEKRIREEQKRSGRKSMVAGTSNRRHR